MFVTLNEDFIANNNALYYSIVILGKDGDFLND